MDLKENKSNKNLDSKNKISNNLNQNRVSMVDDYIKKENKKSVKINKYNKISIISNVNNKNESKKGKSPIEIKISKKGKEKSPSIKTYQKNPFGKNVNRIENKNNEHNSFSNNKVNNLKNNKIKGNNSINNSNEIFGTNFKFTKRNKDDNFHKNIIKTEPNRSSNKINYNIKNNDNKKDKNNDNILIFFRNIRYSIKKKEKNRNIKIVKEINFKIINQRYYYNNKNKLN